MATAIQVIYFVGVTIPVKMSTTQLVCEARSTYEGGESCTEARQMLHSLVEDKADMQDMMPILFMLNRGHFLSSSIPLLVGGASVVVTPMLLETKNKIL